MAVTFKQLINKALRITGEDEIGTAVTAVTDTQHLLIAELANQIKDEVEAAHNWRALRQTVSATVLANTSSITITEANERSRVLRIQDPHYGQEIPLVFDVSTASAPQPLKEVDLADLLYRNLVDPDTRSDPYMFALDNSSGDVLKVHVHPIPSSNTALSLTLIIPQAYLDAGNVTDLATNIKVPTRPIVVGLVNYILEERGEELGPDSMFSGDKFATALRDCVALDAEEQGGYNLVPV